MNDESDLDEIISAYVDGEATDDEIARVRSDPSLLARAEALRALTESIAQVTPPPREQADAHVAAAVAAGSTARAVTDLTAARARRERRGRFMTFAGGVAAALVLVVGLVAVVRSSDDDTDTVATAETGDAEPAERTETAPETSAAAAALAPAADDSANEDAEEEAAEAPAIAVPDEQLDQADQGAAPAEELEANASLAEDATAAPGVYDDVIDAFEAAFVAGESGEADGVATGAVIERCLDEIPVDAYLTPVDVFEVVDVAGRPTLLVKTERLDSASGAPLGVEVILALDDSCEIQVERLVELG